MERTDADLGTDGSGGRAVEQGDGVWIAMTTRPWSAKTCDAGAEKGCMMREGMQDSACVRHSMAQWVGGIARAACNCEHIYSRAQYIQYINRT